MTNVYERRVVVNNNHVSFNGGAGGINARATREEERYSREPHRETLADQMQHERAARQNRQSFASENRGRPAIAATGRAGEFNGRNVVAAREAGEPYRAPKMSPQEARASSSGNRDQQNRNVSRESVNQSKTEQKQQQRVEKAERKQAQQAQKRQQQEQKRGGREERGPGR